MKRRVLYLSWRKSLGAAQADAQCMRWKTSQCQYIFVTPYVAYQKPQVSLAAIEYGFQRTLLNAVLLSLAGLLLLLHDTLGALVVVVLQRCALLGLHALCRK
jgi:hypothetical protein